MADAKAKIILSGEDRTRSAFESAKRNIAQVKASADGLAVPFTQITALVAGVGTALAGLSIKNVINTADQLGKLSQRTGVSVENLSALRYAGQLADVSLDDLTGGLKKLNQTIAQAASGSKEDVATFSAMGIAFKNLDGSVRKADDVLGDIAGKFASYADGANKVELATKLGGKAFEAWIPLLNGGREGLQSARTELEKFGGVMTGPLGEKAAEFNDNLTKMGFAAEALKIQLGSGLIGRLADLSAEFVMASKTGSAFTLVLDKAWDVISGRATAQATGISPLGFFGDDFQVQIKAAERAVDRWKKLRDEAAGATGDDSTSALLRSQLPQINADLAAAEKRLAALRYSRERIDPNAESSNRSRSRVFNPDEKPDAPSVRTPDTKATKELDRARKAYDDLIASINSRITIGEQELATGEKVGEAQKFALDVVGKLAAGEVKLSDAQKRGVSTALEKFLALEKANEAQKELLATQEKTSALARRELDTLFEEMDARAQSNESLRQYVEEIGLTERQVEALEEARIADRIATEQQALAMAQNAEASAEEVLARERNIAALTREIQLRRAASAKRDEIATDPTKGARTAIDDYLQTVRNAGDATRQAVGSAVGQLEDGLTELATKGRTDVRGLVDFMIGEFVRLRIVRPMLADLLGGTGEGGGLGGLGAFFTRFFAGSFATGGKIPAGKIGLVGENGPELTMGPQTIVPMRQGAAEPSRSVVINNNIAAGVTRGELFSALQLVEQSMGGRLEQRLRRAGL